MKTEIRKTMRARLREAGAQRSEKSRAICAAIAAHPAFRDDSNVAVFASLPSEPDLGALWEYGGVRFCFPRVSAERMEFIEVASRDELTPSAWNPLVHEPGSHRERIVAPTAISLILVPGLAFTRDAQRLGRGGGFYDRFLATLPSQTIKVGVCFDCQILDSLPLEPHDHPLDMLVTETGFIAPSN